MTDINLDNVVIEEFKPRSRVTTNPKNHTGNPWFDDETQFVYKRKYIYRISDGSRFCNVDERTHRDNWYSKHDQDGDFYWCPNCDDCQAG